VRLDRSLQQTNILGNQLAEYFISEMQQFGLAVVDFKMTSTLNVTQRGDFVFSRDALKLAKNMKMDHMLSGTMIDKSKGVQINARIISIENGRVVASASVLIPHFIAQSLRPDYITGLSATD
jgi:TolB-like protein